MGYITLPYQLFICLQLFLFYSQCSAILCSHDQSSALLQFKQLFSFKKDSSWFCDGRQQSRPKMMSWKEDADCCSWDGVTCDSVTGHVIGLDLSCSWLHGNIPSNSSLSLLPRLRKLNLAFNDFNYSEISSGFTAQFPSLTILNLTRSNFTGSIPPSLGNNITQLAYLDLSSNSFSGQIPSSFSNLQQLRHLDLRFNSFVGKIPASLGNNITQLAYLDLSSNSFSGQIPSSFSNLQQLRHLDLQSNSFVGKIPASLGNNITLLAYLDLSFNSFSGQIPSSFSNLQQLRHLDLQDNHFVGEILGSLGNNITQLAYLDLSFNSFSGHIPSSFSNLQQLRDLGLGGNKFVGQIPDMFTNLTQLSSLNLADNQLIGSIPSSIFELVNLTEIYLSFNNFSGSIELYDFAKLKNLKYLILSNISLSVSTKLTVNSSFPNLWALGLSACNISEFPDILKTQHQLDWLDLSENQIRGRIPSWMWDIGVHTLFRLDLSRNFLTSIDHLPWKNLEFLTLDSNLLQGSLPNLPPHMVQLSISNNSLTGEIPSSFCNLSSIQYLYLSNNSLSGQIPQCLGNSTLENLDLGMNNFQGSIPQTYAKGCNLTYLRLSGNHLEGPLPPSLSNCVNLQVLDVGNNNLSGPIPECLGNSTSLSFLDVGNNSLSGPIPEYLGNSTLEVLDMRMNKFSGSLPQTFGKSCVLVSLKLNGNRLEGPLPPSLVNCRHLEVIDVGNNQINETFPHWLDVLPELQVLTLRSNRFCGPIGDTKTRVPFPKLRIIDLSYNQFTGVLPIWYLNGFKAMMHRDDNSIEVNYMRSLNYSYYESISLTMKGNDIQMERILTTFATIDLSSNRFQGEISEVLGKLNSLKSLNISHNNLTGGIPSSLRNLTELESLDLSSNKLAGRIPTQLASLNYLSVLNLSNNQLEGPIPGGPQFNTFGIDSYSGNVGLCGFPLSKICRIDEAPEPTTPTGFIEGDDASSWFDWKLAMLGYASGVVIGLSIGYMAFVTGRPQWFVRMIERQQSRKLRRVIRRGRAGRRSLLVHL
ncbi:receptor-like protein 9DC3 isoform X2 [Citrus clementina]|uniref:receptor-like protein 9DC3 isoform X2 n=1 Tax=Citrus clementina TaxID=85681 RepID=UPI000CED6CE8|nr:receptor-like protein 9DC3 isoform X2 [Citrus x clementina]